MKEKETGTVYVELTLVAANIPQPFQIRGWVAPDELTSLQACVSGGRAFEGRYLSFPARDHVGVVAVTLLDPTYAAALSNRA